MVKAKSPEYCVVIKNPTHNLEIVADLPEAFQVGLSSSYDGGGSGFLSNRVALAGTALGGDFVFKPFTKLVWRGTGTIDFTLSLIFDAEENAKEEVFDMITSLSALVLPDNGLMRSYSSEIVGSPNPMRVYSDYNKTSIFIGQQYKFMSVAIVSAMPITESRLESFGWPIAGGVDLTVQTDYMYDKEDWYEATSNTSRKGTSTAYAEAKGYNHNGVIQGGLELAKTIGNPVADFVGLFPGLGSE